MIDSTTIEKLNEQPWADLFVQLPVYTNKLLKRYSISNPTIVLPKGFDSQMVIDEAIESLYTGRRTWDYEAKPDFALFITTQVIRSIVSNLFNSHESKLVKELILADDEDSEVDPIELLIADQPYILENIYEREFLEKAKRLVQMEDDTPDQFLIKIYEGRLQGLQNRHIALELDVPVNNVEAAMKRLRKILIPLFQ